MASQMAILSRAGTLIKTTTTTTITDSCPFFKTISTFTFLSQEPQLAKATHSQLASASTPLPPNIASESPLYNENWRNPIPNSFQTKAPSQTHYVHGLMNVFADWIISQRWDNMNKPNKPDVNLYNHYLTANLMTDAMSAKLLDLVAQMEDYVVLPNMASFNLVLKAMHKAKETVAAIKLLKGTCLEAFFSMYAYLDAYYFEDAMAFIYDLVFGMLLLTDETDAALKYLDVALKSGYMLSMKVFTECVRSCVNKTMDQNKALCPTWNLCNYIAEIAMQGDNSKLAYYALEFMAKWIALSPLLDTSWAILQRSLCEMKAPNPESYLGKIYALASLGNLQRAFGTLNEFESTYGNSNKEAEQEMFSPFTLQLYIAATLMSPKKKKYMYISSQLPFLYMLVYFQLENLSRGDPPYKSFAALNCIILGCANMWDLDRAYQTFEAIDSSFGSTLDIHSYNALMYAFGRLRKTFEASRVFEHFVSLGVQPTAMSYSLLVDAHLINRDPKSALSVIDEMVTAGFVPSKEMLKKVRRRCIREMDYESDDWVESLARKFKIRMGTKNRRDTLFNLECNTKISR
ncbi:hypothetical protein I3760_06G092500 [Carya illinoinensis]|uniref:Pentatricopeptide repeat-containing protein n=1 Tax=Carya illinoinensis TaxID=32201 RepID=A0A922JIE5_CARIL|nr:hypothetical protein I3760_06G092500 [Carya illinoinensis]KAG6708653.1 hypothetical protein I3842_06G092100 [Carya illinoinensis]